MTKILFHGYEKVTKSEGWGDIIGYIAACYCKAKELDVQDINIVFPRFTTQGMYDIEKEKLNVQQCGIPNITILPNDKEPDFSKYDVIIDTSVYNSLYKDFPGLFIGSVPYIIYSGLYYKETGKLPVFDMPRDNISPYILFHIRNYYPDKDLNYFKLYDYNKYLKKIRNSDMITVKRILSLIKDRYGNKFKYICMGDEFDDKSLFDEYIPPDYNLEKYIKLIRNCSLIVAPQSSSVEYAYHFDDIPIIRYNTIKEFDYYYPEGLLRRLPDEELRIKLGKYPNWCDNRMYDIIKYENINRIKLLEFITKQLGRQL